MTKKSFGFMGIVALSLIVVGCGGTAGQGDGSVAAPAAIQGQYGVTVPESSMERIGDAGRFMHTNFVISNRTVNIGTGINPDATSVYYEPAQIRSAYSLPSSGGSGTIAIVDAYHDKYALSDFNTFSSQFGLPQETSTNVTASTNKVLQIVYAQGRQPSFNSGWSQEEDLDIEWAHAMAPSAKIVLVEAASNSNSNLYGADNVAATVANAHECSNSWGGGEYSGESSSDGTFNHTGVVYFFANGDTGGAKDYPPASPNVVAVGGTSLTLNGSGGRASETVWTDTGCGLSSQESRPSFQNGVSGVVGSQRGIGDIAADADPNTGVIVRWNGNWYIFGGTSVATPICSGIANLSGDFQSGGPAQNTKFYGEIGGSHFYDVTSGSAGGNSARVGYDLPTGVGTPNGTGGF